MNTTTLIVEMVVIGLQVAIGLVMVATFVWGIDAQDFDRFEKFATPLTLIAVGVCYTIGLVIDAFTAWIEDRLIPSHISKEHKDERRAMRQRLRLTNRELYADLDRDQYLLRLLRATAFNILIISLLGSGLLLNTRGWNDGGAWRYVSGLIVLALVAGYAWWRRRSRFVTDRDAFYEALKESKGSSPSHAGRVESSRRE